MEDSDREQSDLEGDYPGDDDVPDAQSGQSEDEEDDNESIPSQSEPEEASEEEEELHTISPPPKQSTSEPEPTEDLPSTLRKTREEDRKKGKAVSQQIVRMWICSDLSISHTSTVYLGDTPRCSDTTPKVSDCRQSTAFR